MQVIPYSEADIPNSGVVFRNKSWLALFWTAMVMAGIAVAVTLPSGEFTNAQYAWMPALFSGFLFLLTLERIRICTRERAWLLRVAEEGLYVNLRTFHNYHLPLDTHRVLFLPKGEIAAVGKTQEVLFVPNRRGAHRDQYSYLDIYLKHTDLEPLRQALRAERRLDAAPGFFRRRNRLDYPVRISDTGAVRLVWEWVKPSESRALDVLVKEYPLAPDQKTTHKKWAKMTDEEQERFILDLWEWGFLEDAVRVGKMKWAVGDFRAKKMLAAKTSELLPEDAAGNEGSAADRI